MISECKEKKEEKKKFPRAGIEPATFRFTIKQLQPNAITNYTTKGSGTFMNRGGP